MTVLGKLRKLVMRPMFRSRGQVYLMVMLVLLVLFTTSASNKWTSRPNSTLMENCCHRTVGNLSRKSGKLAQSTATCYNHMRWGLPLLPWAKVHFRLNDFIIIANRKTLKFLMLGTMSIIIQCVNFVSPCFRSQFGKLGVLELHCVSHSVCPSVRPSHLVSAITWVILTFDSVLHSWQYSSVWHVQYLQFSLFENLIEGGWSLIL